MVKWLLFGAAVLALLLLAAQLGAFSGQAPGDMGERDGRLKPPSRRPTASAARPTCGSASERPTRALRRWR